MQIKRFPASLEYKRHKKLSKDAVHRIISWVQNQPHLPNIKEEDVILFLTSCKYDEEVTRKTIDIHYNFKAKHPELFDNWDPLDGKSNLNRGVGLYTVLPGFTAEGHKLLYVRMSQFPDLAMFDPMAELKYLLCTLELMLHEEGAIPGWHIICDIDGTSLRTMLQFSPTSVKNVLFFCQEAAPLQMIGVHIINPPKWITYFTNLFKPFMKKSVSDMLKIHQHMEDFYHYVPKRNLPFSCGGQLASLNELEALSRNKLIENRGILIETQSFRAQLSKENRSWRSFWS